MGWNDVMQQKMADTLMKDLRFHGVENPERFWNGITK
jgi:hypothetical protein